MGTGAITGYIDVAQIALYVFWIFFAGLIFYLRREDRREGYPLEADTSGELENPGMIWYPSPKTFQLANGEEVLAPNDIRDSSRELRAKRTAPWPGAPIEPTGNPMLDGVGPAAWATRPEQPDLTHDEGSPRIVPMRVAADWSVAGRDPDPRGKAVFGVDGEQGGVVSDLWIDLSEPHIRYLEIDAQGRRVLMPMTFARVKKNGQVIAKSVCGKHFADAPGTANPDCVTLQEEDKIAAYYGGGYLYAFDKRREPVL